MARLVIMVLLGVCMSMAYDRLYIKRPLSEKVTPLKEGPHQHPEQVRIMKQALEECETIFTQLASQ